LKNPEIRLFENIIPAQYWRVHIVYLPTLWNSRSLSLSCDEVAVVVVAKDPFFFSSLAAVVVAMTKTRTPPKTYSAIGKNKTKGEQKRGSCAFSTLYGGNSSEV
jgi:hypothetical protein